MRGKRAFTSIFLFWKKIPRNKIFLRSGFAFLIICLLSFVVIRAYTTDQTLSDVVGHQGACSAPDFSTTSYSNPPTADSIHSPYDITLDTVNHRLFAVDSGNNRVLVYNLDSNNNLTDRTADFVIGQPDFTSRGTDWHAALGGYVVNIDEYGFNGPSAVAYDEVADRLFVTDMYNARILVFDTATIVNGEPAVNVLGAPDFNSFGDYSLSPNSFSGGLSVPSNLTVDAQDGLLYVSDTDYVMVFDITTITNGEAAIDILGQKDYLTNNTYGRDGRDGFYQGAYFGNFRGLFQALDSVNHRLFVSDTGGHRVLVYNLDSSNNLVDRVADYVLGQTNFQNSSASAAASPSSSLSQLYSPTHLAYDSNNNFLYVLNGYSNDGSRISVFDVSTITNGMAPTYYIARPVAQSPWGALAYDTTRNKLFAARYSLGSSAIDIFDTSAVSTNMSPQYTFTATTTPNFALGSPLALAYDEVSQQLFYADTEHRVLVYDTSTLSNDLTPQHILGQTIYDNGGASGLSQNKFYFNSRYFGNGTPAISMAAYGNQLFVSDTGNSRIMIFDTSSITDGMNATHVLGQTTFTSVVTTIDQNHLGTSPTGVLFDNANNRLYVGDPANYRVMIFNTSSITDGMNATDNIGQTDGSDQAIFTTADNHNNHPNSAGFYYPSKVAIDRTRHLLFVPDFSRVAVFNLDATNRPLDSAATYVLGKADFSTYDEFPYSASAVNLYNIGGNTYDETTKKLYVADNQGRRIMVFDTTTLSNGQAAVDVFGQPDFVTSSAQTSDVGLSSYFQGVAYDSGTQRLYVADYNYNRIAVFGGAAALSGCPPSNSTPDTPTSLGPTGLVDGSATTDTTPSLNFTLSDPDLSDTVQYHFQLAASSSFASPIVDFTSALGAQGVQTFTVGQAAGSGTYTTGSQGQTLADGNYHWRVSAIDNSNATSSYSTANSGSIAFIVNTTAPASGSSSGGSSIGSSGSSSGTPRNNGNSVPFHPASLMVEGETCLTLVRSGSPTMQFNVSDPDVSNRVRYQIQISTSKTFSSFVTDYTSELIVQGPRSFTVGQGLKNGTYAVGSVGQKLITGTYYWRVQAIDDSGWSSGWIYYCSDLTGNNPTPLTVSLPARATTPFVPSKPADAIPSIPVQPPVVVTPPETEIPPEIKYPISIIINNGNKTTHDTTIDIGLSPHPQVSTIIISNSADRAEGVKTRFHDKVKWDICSNPKPKTGKGKALGLEKQKTLCSSTSSPDTSSGVSGTDSQSTTTSISNQPGSEGVVTPVDQNANIGIGGTPETELPPEEHRVYVTYLDQNGEELGTASSTIILEAPIVSSSGALSHDSPLDELGLAYVREPEVIPLSPISMPENKSINQAYTLAVALFSGVFSSPATARATSGVLAFMAILASALNASLGSFTNVSSLYELWLVVTRALQHVFVLFGLKKKKKYWGTVYDDITKMPIDPAIVEMINSETEELVESAVTDKMGRYGFLVRPGTYRLNVRKTNYRFSSLNMINPSVDDIYGKVYHGESVTIQEADVLALNIPLEPVAPDWNQMTKGPQINFHPYRDKIIRSISLALFWVGCIITVSELIIFHSILDGVLAALYLIIFIINLRGEKYRLWGRIVTRTKSQLSGIKLSLQYYGFDTIISSARTSPEGKFFLKAPEGKYMLNIIQDGKILQTKPVLIGSNGILNSDIKI